MNREDRAISIALAAVPGIGRGTLSKLKKWCVKEKIHLKDVWENIFLASPLSDLQKKGLKEFQQRFTPSTFQEYLYERNIQTVLVEDTVFPFLLKHISDPPLVLFIRGPTDFWNDAPISVVGTRHPTEYGQRVTEKVTSELACCGATLISGFMFGVDLVAHKTALDHQTKSVGVLGFGFNHFYPRMQKPFFEEFLAKGNTLITEFPPNVAPTPQNFPIRNRIVAGLSLATIVTEAAAKSGSLITARFAAEYGRLVCAVPGPITSEFSDGTKALLNEGAKLISSGQEVFEELDMSSKFFIKEKTKNLFESVENDLQKNICTALEERMYYVDDLALKTQLSITQLNRELTHLEVAGIIHQENGKWSLCGQ